MTLRYLINALVAAERQLAAGPWDQWHEEVLVASRDKAREMLDRVMEVLQDQTITGYKPGHDDGLVF